MRGFITEDLEPVIDDLSIMAKSENIRLKAILEIVYSLAVKESLDKKFRKLKKKDRETLVSIDKKVQDILDDPYRFKPSKKPLQNKRRIHNRGIFCADVRNQ